MIFDSLKNAHLYKGTSKDLDMALGYLCRTDFTKLSEGRYDLDGNRVYALVQDYETTSPDYQSWETHQNYVDVQFLYSGREDLGVAPQECLTPVTGYNVTEDYTLFRGQGNFIELNPGYFIVLWPNDAHMPKRTLKDAETVRKVVIKIRIVKDNNMNFPLKFPNIPVINRPTEASSGNCTPEV